MSAKKDKARALSVHLLTASGAVFAMLALLQAVEANWSMMFLWLLVALFVDGIDGPLARRYNVTLHAARYDGVLLDLIIDYLTYAFIPAYALYASGLVPGWLGWGVLIVIPFASAMYFADTRMKTNDKSFLGFPGCWNMVALVSFVLSPPAWLIFCVTVGLAVAMFMPLKFVHPTRTVRWRLLTLPVANLWMILGIWATWVRFDLPHAAAALFTVTSIYLLFAGIAQQVLAGKAAASLGKPSRRPE